MIFDLQLTIRDMKGKKCEAYNGMTSSTICQWLPKDFSRSPIRSLGLKKQINQSPKVWNSSRTH